MEAWQEYFRPGTVVYLHLVKPQRNLAGREIQFIIEFSNRFFDVPAGDTPVVRKIYWEGVWTEAEPVAAYHTQGISTFQLLIQSGLMEWCGPDTRTECNIHIEGRITLPLWILLAYDKVQQVDHVGPLHASLIQWIGSDHFLGWVHVWSKPLWQVPVEAHHPIHSDQGRSLTHWSPLHFQGWKENLNHQYTHSHCCCLGPVHCHALWRG